MKKKLCFIVTLAAALIIMSMTAFAESYSSYWKADSSGVWHVYYPGGGMVKNAWLCDDAVASNGKNVWYLIDENGNMITNGLVQDGTGNYYSLETNHNGYFGMLRYRSGTYDGVWLNLESSHNGSFAAILNQDGINSLKSRYGLKNVSGINNNSCVYTSTFGGSSQSTAGQSSQTASSSGGWKQEGGYWKYYQNGSPIKASWKQIDGRWYYFDGNGRMLAGWQQINGVFYYLEAHVEGYNGHPYGSMWQNETTPDGYRLDANGAWIQDTNTGNNTGSSTGSSSSGTGGKDYLVKGNEEFVHSRYDREVTDQAEYERMCFELMEIWCYARGYDLPVRDDSLRAEASQMVFESSTPTTRACKNFTNPYKDMNAIMNGYKVTWHSYFSQGSMPVGIYRKTGEKLTCYAISPSASVEFD